MVEAATKTDKLNGWWEGVYWHGDYSNGFTEKGLMAAIDSVWDLDIEIETEGKEATELRLSAALLTGELSFGDEDLGISLKYIGGEP